MDSEQLGKALGKLSPGERQRVDRLLRAPRRWQPLPGPQQQAYHSEAFETLYGGAAGGGKSDLLLGLARFEHRRSLLLRRTYPDLERSLIQRSLERVAPADPASALFFGDRAYFNAGKHVWNVDARRIEFGNLEHEGDFTQYQSAQYDLIAFDELTQFTRPQYEYLISRARTAAKGQRVRIVAATNPGGEGNDWVMERWAPWLDETYLRPAKPGEIRWFKRGPDGREIEVVPGDPDAISRTFIPARLADNPHLGDDYRRRLMSLPEPFRSQLLEGDWRAGLTDDAQQVIPRAWVRAAFARWSATDHPADPRPLVRLSAIGTDVARGGDDQTINAKRYGNWLAPLEAHPGHTTQDGQAVAALILEALAAEPGPKEGEEDYRQEIEVNLDVLNVGASAYDFTREKHDRVNPVNFGAGSSALDASGNLSFANVRAECYWRMRELVDPNNPRQIALPPDPELLGDLCAPRWKMQTNGIRIEPKEDIKKRLGRSPDKGDAVVMAFWEDPAGKFGITLV